MESANGIANIIFILCNLGTVFFICEKYDLNSENTLKVLTYELCILYLRGSNKIKKLALDINDPLIHDLIESHFNDLVTIIPFSNIDDAYGKKDQFILCYRQHYNDVYFSEALSRLAYEQYIITAGIGHQILHIDNLFSKHSGLPSHFSNLHYLEQLVASNIPLSTNNWLNFYRILCQDEQQSLPVVVPSKCERAFLAYQLAQQVQNFIDPRRGATVDLCQYFYAIDYKNQRITSEVAIHSPLDKCSYQIDKSLSIAKNN